MWGKRLLLKPTRGGLKSMLGNELYSTVEIRAERPSPSPCSVFLGKIKEAFDRDGELQNLLLDSFFSQAVQDCQV